MTLSHATLLRIKTIAALSLAMLIAGTLNAMESVEEEFQEPPTRTGFYRLTLNVGMEHSIASGNLDFTNQNGVLGSSTMYFHPTPEKRSIYVSMLNAKAALNVTTINPDFVTARYTTNYNGYRFWLFHQLLKCKWPLSFVSSSPIPLINRISDTIADALPVGVQSQEITIRWGEELTIPMTDEYRAKIKAEYLILDNFE
jgi:hypothetical protein